MTTIQLILFILLIQVIHFLGTWKLYQKAGRKWWEAAIPVYNGIVLMDIIKRPKWWVILLFIPILAFGQIGEYYYSEGHLKAKDLNFQDFFNLNY